MRALRNLLMTFAQTEGVISLLRFNSNWPIPSNLPRRIPVIALGPSSLLSAYISVLLVDSWSRRLTKLSNRASSFVEYNIFVRSRRYFVIQQCYI
eukprot:scaffold2541_cov175-Amphora_coffeaeformis.AAC.10